VIGQIGIGTEVIGIATAMTGIAIGTIGIATGIGIGTIGTIGIRDTPVAMAVLPRRITGITTIGTATTAARSSAITATAIDQATMATVVMGLAELFQVSESVLD
jgi:hypothetical protein